MCNVKPNTQEVKLLLNAKLIIWNEAPINHVHEFIIMDILLQDPTKCKKTFGGKVILLGRDFCQVLPVTLTGSRSLTVSSSLKIILFGLIFSNYTLLKI